MSYEAQQQFGDHNELSRKDKRWENKKRKLAAFLQIIKSNDEDRKNKLAKAPNIELEKSNDVSEDDDEEKYTKRKLLKVEKSLTDPIKEKDGAIRGVNENDSSHKQKVPIPKTAPIIPIDSPNLQMIRKDLATRRKAMMNHPKFFLNKTGKCFALSNEEESEQQNFLFVLDVQHLLLKGITFGTPVIPRWCEVLRPGKIRSVVIIIVNGMSKAEYIKHTKRMPNLSLIFEDIVEITPPKRYGSSTLDELLWVGLNRYYKRVTFPDDEDFVAGMKNGTVSTNNPYDTIFNVAKTQHQNVPKFSEINCEECTKLSLILSPQQMIQECYPFPGTRSKIGNLFVPTKNEYNKVSNNSQLFGVDCEMCLTTNGYNELTRVSIVNEKLETVYDTLVKPRAPITDYLTRWSGITKEMLKDVTTRIEDVQLKFRELLPDDAILVGQSLCSDLMALEMTHPFVIDTSVIYNLSGTANRKTGLKNLVKRFLGEDIQNHGNKGHNPIEDSLYAMKLVLLKLQNGLTFGDVRWMLNPKPHSPPPCSPVTENNISDEIKNQYISLINPNDPFSSWSVSLFQLVGSQSKKVALIENEGSKSFYKKMLKPLGDCKFIKRLTATDLDSTVELMEKTVKLNDVSICNIDIVPEMGKKRKSMFKNLDIAIKRIYNACMEDSLIVVLTEDDKPASNGENGLCFVKIKLYL